MLETSTAAPTENESVEMAAPWLFSTCRDHAVIALMSELKEGLPAPDTVRLRATTDTAAACEKFTASQGAASQAHCRQPEPPTPFALHAVEKLLSIAFAAHCAMSVAVWGQQMPQPQSSRALPAVELPPLEERATLAPEAKADSSTMLGMLVIQPVPWQVVPLAERRKPAQTPAPETGGVVAGVWDAIRDGEGEKLALGA